MWPVPCPSPGLWAALPSEPAATSDIAMFNSVIKKIFGTKHERQMKRMQPLIDRIAGERLACGHFHDTRGLGLANVFAAWQVGVRRFDACLGGIGGCPHAPGASGNASSEISAPSTATSAIRKGPRAWGV